jgi:hypothetical protein
MLRLLGRTFNAGRLKELAHSNPQAAVKFFVNTPQEDKPELVSAFPVYATSLLKHYNSTPFVRSRQLQDLVSVSSKLNEQISLPIEAAEVLQHFGENAMATLNLDNLDLYLYFAWNSYKDAPFPFDPLLEFLLRPIPSSDSNVVTKWVKLANDVMFYALPEVHPHFVDYFTVFFGGHSQSLATLVKIATVVDELDSDEDEEAFDLNEMSMMLDVLKPTYKDYRVAADYVVHATSKELTVRTRQVNDDALSKMLDFAFHFKDFEFIAYIFDLGVNATKVRTKQSSHLPLEAYAYMMHYLLDTLSSGWVEACESEE